MSILKIKSLLKRIINWLLNILIGIEIILMLLIMVPVFIMDNKEAGAAIVMKHLFGRNAAYIVSLEGDIYSLQENGQSYLMNTNYIYTYGPNRFVYVNTHTGDVYVVLSDDIDKEIETKLKKRLFRVNKNEDDAPKFYFLKESQLDKDNYEIMKFLKEQNVQYPRFMRNKIYERGY